MLLRTRAGRTAAQIAGSTVALMEFLPQAVVRPGEARPAGWRDLGEAAARLNLRRDYRRPFAISISRALGELAERAKGELFERQFLDVLTRLSSLTERTHVSLIHGEINQANALRRADDTIVFVDWDQAGTAPTSLEYGYPLITNFISEQDHAFDLATAAAFYDGYRAGGGEIRHAELFDAALFHALRYMWWGDTSARWQRILYALDNEDGLLAELT